MPQFMCPNCRATAQVPARQPLIVYGPEDRHSVLCFEPFYVPCAVCGEQVLAPYPCAYTDVQKGFTIRLTPPEYEPIKAPTKGCQILRDTDNVLSFREKIILFEAGYDDRAVEILKLFTEITNDTTLEQTMVIDANDKGLLMHAFGADDASITFASPRELYGQIEKQLGVYPPDTRFSRVDHSWAASHVQVDETARNIEIQRRQRDAGKIDQEK